MKSTNDGFNYVLRLDKGELLVESLTGFVRGNSIKGAWISGLGGLMWAELGFYDLTNQEYRWTKLVEPLELTSLTGNIAWEDNELAMHLHANVGDASMIIKGGHLKEAEVAGTVELFIHVLHESKQLNRSKDADTGLNLLKL